uniref:RxLR effector protein n=1 Tax=Hyaloperonospora arabidopsidis (strain Emoy2) TaxID=559515 RepID=M4C3L4_HYAAE
MRLVPIAVTALFASCTCDNAAPIAVDPKAALKRDKNFGDRGADGYANDADTKRLLRKPKAHDVLEQVKRSTAAFLGKAMDATIHATLVAEKVVNNFIRKHKNFFKFLKPIQKWLKNSPRFQRFIKLVEELDEKIDAIVIDGKSIGKRFQIAEEKMEYNKKAEKKIKTAVNGVGIPEKDV